MISSTPAEPKSAGESQETRLAPPSPFGDEPGWRRPSPKLRQMRRLEAFGTTLLVLLLIAASSSAGGGGIWLVAYPLTLLAGAIGWIYLSRRSASWGYLERVDDLLVRRGVMFRRLSVVPYGRMQTVEVSAGPIERYFDLATVRLHTAAAASDARIPGLSSYDATQLRDRLARLGEASAEGL